MFQATPHKDWESYDYILGKGNNELSISVQRYKHLWTLNQLCGLELVLSFKDKDDSDKWTKWTSFDKLTGEDIMYAYDIHRSILPNEVIVESDYPTYEENYEATRLIGAILEGKGFKPSYYYSGSKSIHIHVLLDFKSLLNIPMKLQEEILRRFKYKTLFVKKFMTYLRRKMISCWDMKLREFDEGLAKGRHLIRSEMSRNKKGYKTYLGSSFKDLPPIPYICNETKENRIYPKIGPINLSKPHNCEELITEFLSRLDDSKCVAKARRKEVSLKMWLNGDNPQTVKPCVEKLLEADLPDGHNRAMFILLNELKRVYGNDRSLEMVKDWNVRTGLKVRETEIEYRYKMNRDYRLGCDYIKGFLKETGLISVCNGCTRQ